MSAVTIWYAHNIHSLCIKFFSLCKVWFIYLGPFRDDASCDDSFPWTLCSYATCQNLYGLNYSVQVEFLFYKPLDKYWILVISFWRAREPIPSFWSFLMQSLHYFQTDSKKNPHLKGQHKDLYKHADQVFLQTWNVDWLPCGNNGPVSLFKTVTIFRQFLFFSFRFFFF